MPDESPATKADIALLKADLEARFAKTATKDDIANMATKDDIANMATKDDIARLSQEIVKNSADIREIKATMSTKDDVSRIMGAIDGFAFKLETFSRESFTLPATLDKHGETLRGHEAQLAEHDRRLKAVETPP